MRAGTYPQILGWLVRPWRLFLVAWAVFEDLSHSGSARKRPSRRSAVSHQRPCRPCLPSAPIGLSAAPGAASPAAS
jgi:hypothetical protein